MDKINLGVGAINQTKNFLKDSFIPIIKENTVCNVDTYGIFLWWILPCLLFLIILLIIRNRNYFLVKWFKFQSQRGLIKIILRRENKNLKEFLVKIDTYGNFKFKKRRYTLENLQDFIIGYDKHKFPVFFYDYQFILPLEITKTKIDNELKKILKNMGIPKKEQEEKISQFAMAINPAMLDLVYSRKLMSDLYSISRDENTKKILIFAIIGIALLIILYYTGLPESLLGFFGVDISTPSTATTTP